MKQEFVAIVPTGRDGGQTVARARGMRGYSVAFDHPSLLLLVNDTGGTVSLGDAGVVVGTIFDQPARCPLEDLPVRAVQAARDSYVTSLFTQFWGGYVALLTQEDGSVAIVRDPSGSIPCWWTREGDAVIVTSAARDCVAEGLVKGAFDWESVSSHLLWPERHPSRTAIAGLEELLQGSRLQLVGADIRVDYPWTPWGFTAAGACIEKSDEAIDLVRRATLNAIHGWTKRYSSPLVSLSGGLDSSIVLAGTKGIAATAITISTNEPIGDERLYARAAAQYCAIRLVEQQLSLDDIKPEISNAVTSPRPIARLFGQGFDRLWRDVALKYGSDALFHGGGGDNVFCYLTSATPYLDSFLYNGPGVRTRATLLGLSQMTGVSTWRVRRGALRKLILDRGLSVASRRAVASTAREASRRCGRPPSLVRPRAGTDIAGKARPCCGVGAHSRLSRCHCGRSGRAGGRAADGAAGDGSLPAHSFLALVQGWVQSSNRPRRLFVAVAEGSHRTPRKRLARRVRGAGGRKVPAADPRHAAQRNARRGRPDRSASC